MRSSVCEHKTARVKTKNIFLDMLPKVSRIPQRMIDVDGRKILRWILESSELPT